jgi:antitoxin MazE
MQIAKWGNSLAVRLPAVVEALELREGNEIKIHVADAHELLVARKPGREALLQRLRDFRRRLRRLLTVKPMTPSRRMRPGLCSLSATISPPMTR